MANDNITVDFDLNKNSKYRVAFDLMQSIASSEVGASLGQEHPREYALTLFHHCLSAVNGNRADEILESWEPSDDAQQRRSANERDSYVNQDYY